MKRLLRALLVLGWLAVAVSRADAQFTSLYAFGDGVSTTTNGPGGTFYYGKRFTNGRVWVEVLAERQGLVYNSARNWSYFGHYSPNLVTNVGNFVAPPDVGTALFAIWVNNADFVSHLADSRFAPYNNSNLAIWTNALSRSWSNHLQAIQILHAKGARTIVMPNAVDVTKVPYYVGLPDADKAFLRQRITDFNTGFANSLAQAQSTLPGLAIHVPDVSALFDDAVANPANYGLVNALENGRTIDALSDFALTDKSLAGPGANYIFWDYLDPTAKAHAIIADLAHELVSPVRINTLAIVNGGNVQLELSNLPIGLDGFVQGSGNFGDWPVAATIQSTAATLTIQVPVAGPVQFYRLRFPHAWTWP